jgi:type 1 glutamine amidotransferase
MNRFEAWVILFGLLFASLAGIGSEASAEDSQHPIRVLILTGSNNHNWKETTPMLQKLLETSGLFRVDTTVPPQGLSKDSLQRYDVILSNWNSWGSGTKEAEAAWTADVREAYLDFVRGGKGHVTVHAGGSSFYDGWPEYREVSLVFWDLGKTGHGRQHEFKVRIDQPDHPITTGLKPFTIGDELWNKPGIAPAATVLASAYSDKQNEPRGTDQWEPSAVIADYGKGRCFATLLGHDAKIMENEGFQQLLVRGVQWAATGKVTPVLGAGL